MKRLVTAMVVVGLCAAVLTAAEDDGGAKCHCKRHGLVAHYYKDAQNWDGNWPAGSKPQVDPKDWTFTRYDHSQIEPLVNHLFIRRGWFSVRWQGSISVPGDGDGLVSVTFEVWADDGCRLFIDGEKVIDDWRDVAEDATDSHRSASVNLTPGKHKIVIEYFQGESLKRDDRDPIKLYWTLPVRGGKKHIVPASALSYGEDDLFPKPGRDDKQGEEFIEEIIEKLKGKK